MSLICPTITAENPHVYREQMERVSAFAKRIHIDLMDGVFTPNKSVELSQVWWPDGFQADLHVMFAEPLKVIDQIVALQPSLVIVHASDPAILAELTSIIQPYNIKLGLALFPDDQVEVVSDMFLQVDHVLIFSGNLGYQGGSTADLDLLSKVAEIKRVNPAIEIAWDGGVNDQNVAQIAKAGVDIINTGGYVHTASNPEAAYKMLQSKVD